MQRSVKDRITGSASPHMPCEKTYCGRMSVLVEVIAAVVQGVIEAVGDLFLHRNSGAHQDED